MNLLIELDGEKLRTAIADALVRGPRLMGGNPLMAALSKALDESNARLEAWAKEQLHTVLADASFRDELRRTIKQAMLGEAEAMGRKAARAAVNAKETP